jgi:hypothetical protein
MTSNLETGPDEARMTLTNRKPSSKRLDWKGRTVHFGRRVLATIVPDDTYPAVWRVKLPDGQLTVDSYLGVNRVPALFTKFDPHAFLLNEQQPPAKPAKAAKVSPGPTTLATLATLAPIPVQTERGLAPADAKRSFVQATVWDTEQDERAAIAEFDGGAPRRWAEAITRLDPAKPPGDVPPKRWVQFIDDCGRLLDDGWAARAEILGWGPLDFFGCDRERPFSRIDHLGLVWLLNGDRILELHRDRAITVSASGSPQSYRRGPVEVGAVVLAWELQQ